MKRIRVLVIHTRRTMHQILSDILATQPDIEVADEPRDVPELADAVRRCEADVVILEEKGPSGVAAHERILLARPGLKMLSIMDEGRETYLYELCPHELALGQLSATALLDAVRGSPVPPAR